MANIRVRLKNRDAIRAKLRPQQGVQVDNQKLYLYDPSLIDDEVALARDWAIKTDGLVEEEDYSSKAWAIGGTGTETNNSKYYASQASTSAGNAYTSETNAAVSASTATTQAGIATTQAGIATTKAGEAATSASTATTQAGIATTQAGIATTKAGEASTSATNASTSAGNALTYSNNASASATAASNSATSASNSADLSKQWAIGVPTEPADGSAKYWAGQAQSAVESIGDATLTIQKNGSDLGTFTANATVDKTIDIPIPTTAADVNALPDTTKYGATITASLNTTDYKLTLTLKDQNGNTLGTAQVIDFPIESVVVNGAYDSVNKKIVLTLQNGTTIDIPVGDLISGLQTEITVNNKLNADLVDDSTSTNKFVTASDITTWDGKQDAISDLSTIRTNASNGASAYTTIQGYGDIVTHDASEFATSAQGALADTALQSGDNISELVNNSGYITSSALAPYVLASSLATVATSGDYDDLINKPTIPAAQIQSDWTQADNTKLDYIKNKPTIPTVNNSTITLTQGGITKGSFTLNQSTGATIALDAGGGSSLPSQTGHAGEFLTTDGTDASWAKAPTGRNVGELVYSAMPLTDAGLHLLDGTLLSGGGIYEEFVQYVAGLVSSYPSLFTSESTWQSTVSSKGVCGKFVYTAGATWYKWYSSQWGVYFYVQSLNPQYGDPIFYYDGSVFTQSFYVATVTEGSPDDTMTSTDGMATLTRAHGDTTIDIEIQSSVRLPKITGIIEGTTSVSALGDLVAAGLPNITGTIGDTIEAKLDPTTTGAFYLTTTSSGGEGNGGYRYFGMGLDASLSNSIYGNSTTVQPQTIKQLVYIVVANSTKTEIEVDIDQIVTDLNMKVDLSSVQTIGGTKTFSNAVYAGASQTNGTVVTTVSKSKSSNGYYKFGNGLIIQWGTIGISTYNATGTVTLPTAFTSTNYSVSAVGRREGGSGQGELSLTATKSKTQFSWRLNAGSNYFNDAQLWIAIGY